MENREQNESFNYTYSAKQQAEVESIRKKYMPAAEDKMEQLRRLDRSVTQKATAVSIVTGIIGALIFGVGMCCCMVWTGRWYVPGIIVGIAGMAVVAAAYPMFVSITKKERQKIAPKIMRLSDELMK